MVRVNGKHPLMQPSAVHVSARSRTAGPNSSRTGATGTMIPLPRHETRPDLPRIPRGAGLARRHGCFVRRAVAADRAGGKLKVTFRTTPRHVECAGSQGTASARPGGLWSLRPGGLWSLRFGRRATCRRRVRRGRRFLSRSCRIRTSRLGSQHRPMTTTESEILSAYATTDYRRESGEAGGHGTEFRSRCNFLPAPPAAAGRLTLRFTPQVGTPVEVELSLPGAAAV
jgi:hypothetical protein